MFNLSFIGDLTVDVYKDLKKIRLGGASLNQAIWTKRLGHNPTVLAAIGEDDFGKKYLDFLKKENINALVKQIKGKTSRIEIFLDENGERHWGKWAVGVMRDYHLGDEEKDFLLTQDAVCLPVYFPTKHLLSDLSNLSHLGDLFIISDFDDLSQFNKNTGFLEKNLPFLDLVFCGLDKENDKELIEKLKILSGKFQKIIVVTLNVQGSVCFAKGREFLQKAEKINAVDTTGGGDAFLVGFVIEYLKSKNIKKSLEKGKVLATKAISRLGAY